MKITRIHTGLLTLSLALSLSGLAKAQITATPQFRDLDSALIAQSTAMLNEQFAATVEYVKSDPAVKKSLLRWIRDTNDVRLSVSERVNLLDPDFVFNLTTSGKLAREYKKGIEPEEGLYQRELTREIRRKKEFESYVVPELRQLSSEEEPDLNVRFYAYQPVFLVAIVEPSDEELSLSAGMDFVIYFNSSTIRQVYSFFRQN